MHHNDILMSGYRYLRRGQKVQFTLREQEDGLKATEVELIEETGDGHETDVLPSEPQAEPEPTALQVPSKSGKSYRPGQRLVSEEDRENEFKSLTNARDPVKTITEYYVDKYVNAFLNTEGGVIYFGIDDDGRVQGIQLDRSQRDQLRTEISRLINKFQPSVEPELYRIEFVPVEGGNSTYVVELNVRKGLANLYMTGGQNFFIRRDGSNFLMSFDMIRRRLQAPPALPQMQPAHLEAADRMPAKTADASEDLDLGVLLAMVFMSWSHESLSDAERQLLETRARDEGLEEDEVRALREAMQTRPLLETIASYLPTRESRKAAATIAYLTALSDSIITESERAAFEKMCDVLGISLGERDDILMLGEQRIA